VHYGKVTLKLVDVYNYSRLQNNGTRIKIETYYDVAGLEKITQIGDLVESYASLPLLLR